MKGASIFITLLLATIICHSQNLVPNSGFEDFYICPQSINTNKANINIAPYWSSPSYGTPDLFNRYSKSYKTGIQNIAGFTTPFSGDGFAGIVTWTGQQEYREFLRVELLGSLKANHTYKISFYYKLSSYSMYSIDRIGFSLTDTSVFYKFDTVIPLSSTYSKIKDKALDPYTGSWELLETEYLAKGKERYLIIGNFHRNNNTNSFHLSFLPIREPLLAQIAYYYIDEVSVFEKTITSEKSGQTLASLNNRFINFKDSYILENVLFDHDSDQLLPESFDELNQIIEILDSHPDWNIKITGHTDNLGSIEYNQNLSERRALSVAEFLTLTGIQQDRILTIGYGNTKPIVDNNNDTNRRINRRIEVFFLNNKDK